MHKKITISRTKRIICFFLALNLIFEIISPSLALALTSGPAQEEFASFEPSTTTDMVDLYSGDFTYNIPLMSVPGPNGGYPLNLSYHSGVGMEQEASWVGLGWSLNVGAINRQMRGLPDDFDGELIQKRQHMKESWMVALDIPKNKYTEVAGLPPSGGGFGTNIQVYYNNYKGMGYRYLTNFAFPYKGYDESMWKAGLNIGFDSQNGLDVEPQLSVAAAIKKTSWKAGVGVGLSYNSRHGLQKLSFTNSLHRQRKLESGIEKKYKLNSNLSFAPKFSVAETKMKTKTTTASFNIKIAKPSTMWKWPTFESKFPLLWSGYVTKTSMVNKGKSEFSAYGYLNNLSTPADNVMRDFSRDEGQYSKKIPNLPMSSFTYDMFSQTGQGTGSNFRAYQNQIHVLSDPEIIGEEDSYDGEFEFGFGPGIPVLTNPSNLHLGLSFNYGSGQNRSGSWKTIKSTSDVSATLTSLKTPTVFSPGTVGKYQYSVYENNYFKAYGEKTGYFENGTEDQLSYYDNEEARRFEVVKEKNDNNFLNRHYKINDNLIKKEGDLTPKLLSARPLIGDGNRAKRANNIEYLTHAQAQNFGYSKNLQYYNSSNVLTPKFPSTHSSKHLSEISMLQPDGMRYVYGLASYNKKQVDNVFSSKNTGDFNTNTVNINSGSIEGIDILGTQEEFMERNELPEYANGWLLTSIFSADYVDLTNDGPTDDDYGFWIKFNYSKTHNNYKWRAPYTGANFIEGYKNDPQDDKASYTYGEKEIYFVHSVESKTHLAKFITSDRRDAMEAPGEFSNSGTGAATVKKLDKIILYSKKDLAVNTTAATPIKAVNFVYSYELCPGIPNNSGAADVTNDSYDETGTFVPGINNINTAQGKLTLKQIYYTYQNSSRSQLSPYIFKYGQGSQLNPSYERRNMDKWGNFKNNTGLYSSGNTYPFIDNPYTPQDPSFYGSGTNQLAAGQWSLKQVLLPTGGTMNINYEFDDYYYEENLKAQRMYDVIGIGNNQGAARNGTPILGNVESYKIYIALEDPVTTKQEFYDKYVAKLSKNQVFYKVLAQMKGMGANNTFDYVSGYAEVDSDVNSYDIESAGTIGYVSLKKVPLSKSNIGGTMVSPITRSIIEHLKTNRSELIHSAVPYASTAKAQILNVLSSVSSVFTDITQAVTGFNRWAYSNLYGSGTDFKIKLNGNSIIRLCDPDEKIGGGVRVKKLTMDDNWKNGATNDLSTYGQEYDYTTTDANGKKISSGVSYEPQIGAEESALRTAIKYSSSSLFKSDYNMFVETPIAKSYYPGESVGYSKVTVRSIGAQELYTANGLTNLPQSNAAPLSVYEFFTPKDFPVIVKETDNGPYSKPIYIPIPVLGLFTKVKRRQAKSQGYTVIINDMAGKPKSTSIYTAKLSAVPNVVSVPDKLVSKQNYIYNTKTPYNPNAINELSNKVQVISVNPSYQTVYQTAVLGQTHDMFIDMNEDSQEHEGFGATGNLDVAFITSIPFFIPIPWVIPSYHQTTNNMRTVVFNKIIYKTGILNKVETTTDKSTITSENLAYDIETGQPLLTKITNEFKDPIYNFSFPGHWYYKNLAAAYKNFGVKITSNDPNANNNVISSTTSNASTGIISTTNLLAPALFTKGDLVYIESSTPNASGLYHIYALGNSSLHCVDKTGVYFPPGANVNSIQIVRSGYKNLQDIQIGNLQFKSIKNSATTPDFVPYDPAISTTSKTSPTNVTFDSPTDNKILNSSAVEMNDDWQMQCGNNYTQFNASSVVCLTTPVASSELFSFLNNLVGTNQLFNKNVLIVQNNNPSGSPLLTSGLGFNNGFTNNLLNAFQALGQISNYNIVSNPNNPISNQSNLYYSGFISPSTKNYVIIISNFLIPASINDPGLLASPAYFSLLPLPGLRFGMPPAIVSSVTNPNAFWTNFVTNAPSTANWPGNLAGFNTCWNLGDPGFTSNISGFGSQTIYAYCNFPASVNGVAVLSCIPFAGCFNSYNTVCTFGANPTQIACGTQSNSIVNPYQNGMKGIWRTKRMHAFNTSRTQNENIREDGILTSFVRFPWESPSTKDAKWIESNTVTKYNQEGFEIENRNAIGNFSSALYGYQNSLNTAVANNARYSDIGVDNFEDYPKNCNQDHFSYSNYSANVTNTEAHTGKYSINVPNASKAKVYRNIFVNCDNNTVNGAQYVIDNIATPNTYNSQNVAHVVKPCDCIGLMAPQVSKKYIVSAWVKQKSTVSTAPINYTNSQVDINFYNAAGIISSVSFLPSGNIIDGWQRIYGEFTLPATALSISVELNNLINVSTTSVYFDDVRVQPFDASMKSYVYDAITSKVMAELDDNNFATIYNYDDEGNLIKVKRETEKGIKTVKEGRVNSKKVKN